ncbi:hypothetical protein [Pedobacter miscanthi]|uniref:Uncharacterized protein n=1 Tax=Pedobacter miscanthi TaxID=2259170 RepID=A0A366LES1_9SPHI|nr:hypothetical protein [Pedobacter miscanthi]RBQ11774.1 hypothetical protein DRW42_00410 [Pedobacter miscanthi]
MKKIVDGTIIIFKDPITARRLYFSGIAYLCLFAGSVIWLIGIFAEFYIADQDFIIGIVVLSLVSLLFGWKMVSKILEIMGILRKNPLITISRMGIAVFGDTIKLWSDIKQIRLIADFDRKYIELRCFVEENSKSYMLYAAPDTSEFENLAELKSVLDLFANKTTISEY